MTDAANIETTLHRFLTETTGESSLARDTDLLASGLLDSLTMMELVVFIEVEFQHRIAVDDMRPEKFQTIGAIAQVVAQLESGEGARRAA